MSSDEAERIENSYKQWDDVNAKKTFISRMEHKLNRKERVGRF